MTEQHELEQLAKSMYKEALSREEACGIVDACKITVLFGPPLVRPDVFLVSSQGADQAPPPSRTCWPKSLLYLDDGYDFGRWLCNRFRCADLSETLKKRTVAMAACFPEAKADEQDSWIVKRGPKAEWLEFSTKWVKRMIRKTRPRVVLVIGSNASKALGLKNKWCPVELRPSDRHMVYGYAKVEGSHAVYCHGRRGASNADVQKCLCKVKQLIAKDID